MESQSQESTDQMYDLIDTWEPDTVNLVLEVGMRGVCNHCDADLIEVTSEEVRLQCPDCGYTVGLVIRFPELQNGGEPGEASVWPDEKHSWDVDDGRATIDIGFRGTHKGCGTFVENNRDTQSRVPNMCCDGCGDQFSKAMTINTLVDPVNNINHL